MSSPEDRVAKARVEHSASAAVPGEEQLRTLLEVVPQQIFVLRPDFTIEYANKAILDYHGEALTAALFSPDVFERDRVLHHPDDVRRLMEDGGHRLLRGLPVELEGRLLGADGKYRWFLMRINPLRDAHGHVVRWYGTRTDIDALKRSEERMRQDLKDSYSYEDRYVADYAADVLKASSSQDVRVALAEYFAWRENSSANVKSRP